MLHEVIKAVYEILRTLNVMLYLEKELVLEFSDDYALEFTEALIKIDPDYAKPLMKDNPYLEHMKIVILDLSIPDTELAGDNSRKTRKRWLELLKRHCPEILAELH